MLISSFVVAVVIRIIILNTTTDVTIRQNIHHLNVHNRSLVEREGERNKERESKKEGERVRIKEGERVKERERVRKRERG